MAVAADQHVAGARGTADATMSKREKISRSQLQRAPWERGHLGLDTTTVRFNGS